MVDRRMCGYHKVGLLVRGRKSWLGVGMECGWYRIRESRLGVDKVRLGAGKVLRRSSTWPFRTLWSWIGLWRGCR